MPISRSPGSAAGRWDCGETTKVSTAAEAPQEADLLVITRLASWAVAVEAAPAATGWDSASAAAAKAPVAACLAEGLAAVEAWVATAALPATMEIHHW